MASRYGATLAMSWITFPCCCFLFCSLLTAPERRWASTPDKSRGYGERRRPRLRGSIAKGVELSAARTFRITPAPLLLGALATRYSCISTVWARDGGERRS